MDTQEDQGESQLPPTEEDTTSYSNTNAHDSYYNGERYSAYGFSNYYPPPPPPPPAPGPGPSPQPPPHFHPSMHSVRMYYFI